MRLPVIVGPTASGKTMLSLELASRFEGIEIVSADSRQVYIGMDIGTAKPTSDELRAVSHHMIDIVAPDVLYSAGQYAARARAVVADILEREKRPLVVGGSGFYIRALFEGLGAPTVDQGILDRLKEREEREGYEALYRELESVDPVAAAMHSPNNRVKTLRALCCYYQTGELYSSFMGAGSIDRSPLTPDYIGIAPPRELLYHRIDERVAAMLEAGLVAETRGLLDKGYRRGDPGLRTVGYAEVIRHLEGELDYDRMKGLIQQSTRRYAKRQMTWFRRVEGVRWMEGVDLEMSAAWFAGGDPAGSKKKG